MRRRTEAISPFNGDTDGGAPVGPWTWGSVPDRVWGEAVQWPTLQSGWNACVLFRALENIEEGRIDCKLTITVVKNNLVSFCGLEYPCILALSPFRLPSSLSCYYLLMKMKTISVTKKSKVVCFCLRLLYSAAIWQKVHLNCILQLVLLWFKQENEGCSFAKTWRLCFKSNIFSMHTEDISTPDGKHR